MKITTNCRETENDGCICEEGYRNETGFCVENCPGCGGVIVKKSADFELTTAVLLESTAIVTTFQSTGLEKTTEVTNETTSYTQF